MNPLKRLSALGQSVWYDYIRRDLYEGPELQRLIDEDGFPPGIAVDSAVAVRYVDGELAEVVSPREDATAYRVEAGSETPLEARIVG